MAVLLLEYFKEKGYRSVEDHQIWYQYWIGTLHKELVNFKTYLLITKRNSIINWFWPPRHSIMLRILHLISTRFFPSTHKTTRLSVTGGFMPILLAAWPIALFNVENDFRLLQKNHVPLLPRDNFYRQNSPITCNLTWARRFSLQLWKKTQVQYRCCQKPC